MVRLRRQVPALTSHNFTFTDITVSRGQNIVYTYGQGEETGTSHRRRMETEEKVKVVTSVWGADLFNSLPGYL